MKRHEINLDRLEKAIDAIHHQCTRFFDPLTADTLRKDHEELLYRFKSDIATDSDLVLAQTILENSLI